MLDRGSELRLDVEGRLLGFDPETPTANVEWVILGMQGRREVGDSHAQRHAGRALPAVALGGGDHRGEGMGWLHE
ncbi:MAG: hypothetical protein ACRD12_16240 [Acidimicrobiales bacterium]